MATISKETAEDDERIRKTTIGLASIKNKTTPL
jgi:hypothetical protein